MKQYPSYVVVRCLVAATLLVSLTACVSNPKKGGGNYSQLIGQAEADVSAGRIEPALAAFNEAAKADPTNKEPWVRSAQLAFDAGNYGRAITAAEEVLRRDPADLVADSVLTVSGLRVAVQSLQRLQANGALATSDTARKEAEQLASALRSTMGESPSRAASTPAPCRGSRCGRPAARPQPQPQPQAKPSDENPFR